MFWTALGAAVFMIVGRPALAAEWSITGFHADIEVNADASITVHETIAVDFGVAKRGIWRDIPFRYPADGSIVSVPINVQRLSLDGVPVPYETAVSGDARSIKIGDPDVTITGAHHYDLVYKAGAAVNFFDDHDELYWNVTGTEWEVPITRVTGTVALPAGVAASDVRTRCFTGQVGSRQQACATQAQPSGATFSSQDFVTVVVGWPTGVITKPADYDQLRAEADRPSASNLLSQFGVPWIVIFNLALPVLVAVALFFYWKRHGHDPQTEPRTTVVQYDPPDKLTPGEVGVLFDEKANPRDISAIIIDLAVRGYLSITEVRNERFLRFGRSTDYVLQRERDGVGDVSLQRHERTMLDALFADGPSVHPAPRKPRVLTRGGSGEVIPRCNHPEATAVKPWSWVHLSDLRGKLPAQVRDIADQLYQAAVVKGHFVARPDTVRKKFLVFGIVVSAIGAFVPFLFPGFLITGVLIVIFSRVMPKRTPRGVKALWHARGFKEYLEKAEKYRLQWQEQEHIFEQFLPFAMAFGVADKWSKAFADIAIQPPRWYHGTYDGGFNSLLLWSSLSSLHTQATQAFAPPAAQGSSGFGSGGFSGGGFGGGGGGSW
ncbi:MAG: DUF2207 domain-containing protein [Candidatus Kerfeldbacteria bacterium]|nr:DUF2207 domain-containing protein [Candidatus Kerfeldbacteria bacterium]